VGRMLSSPGRGGKETSEGNWDCKKVGGSATTQEKGRGVREKEKAYGPLFRGETDYDCHNTILMKLSDREKVPKALNCLHKGFENAKGTRRHLCPNGTAGQRRGKTTVAGGGIGGEVRTPLLKDRVVERPRGVPQGLKEKGLNTGAEEGLKKRGSQGQGRR